MHNIIDFRDIFVGRNEEQQIFGKLITNQLAGKFIMMVSGGAGLGKSHLLAQLSKLAKESGNLVAFVDFYQPDNRKYHTLIGALASQLRIKFFLEDELLSLAHASDKDQLIERLESTTRRFHELARGLPQKPTLFFDTFDLKEIRSLRDLDQWFLAEFLIGLAETGFVVLSGRTQIDDLRLIKRIDLNYFYSCELRTFEISDSMKMCEKILSATGGIIFPDKDAQERFEATLEKAAYICQGNPLLLAWFTDMYMRGNLNEQEQLKRQLEKGKMSEEDISDLLAQMTMSKQTPVEAAIRLAAHSPLRFDLPIYQLLVNESQLGNFRTHEEVLLELDKLYLVRARGESRMLHDRIRTSITKYQQRGGADFKALSLYSAKLVQDYYEPEIERVRNKMTIDSYDYEITISGLQNEMSYHDLFANYGKLNTLRKHWSRWDKLWTNGKFDEVAVNLDTAHLAYESLPFKGDKNAKILKAMIDSARAWAIYRFATNEERVNEAISLAIGVLEDPSAPHRLRATAAVALGEILTSQGNFKDALQKLDIALGYYNNLIERVELANSDLDLLNEFVDMDVKGLQEEKWRVLIDKGWLHRTQFISLSHAEQVYRDAYYLAQQLEKPEFQANALSHLAVVKRFLGKFNEGLNLVSTAIGLLDDTPSITKGNLYETAGLIYRDRGELNEAENWLCQALSIFKEIGTWGEIGQGRVYRDLSDIMSQKGDFDRAEGYLEQADGFFSQHRARYPSQMMNLLNKKGFFSLAKARTVEKAEAEVYYEDAKQFFNDQLQLANKHGDIFWKYHAEQSLAELEWAIAKNQEIAERIKKQMSLIVKEYLIKGYDFSPLYSRSEQLMAQIAEWQDQREVMFIHLVNAIGHIAIRNKVQYERLLAIIRNELAKESKPKRSELADKLMAIWIDKGLGQEAPDFIYMCRMLGHQIVSLS